MLTLSSPLALAGHQRNISSAAANLGLGRPGLMLTLLTSSNLLTLVMAENWCRIRTKRPNNWNYKLVQLFFGSEEMGEEMALDAAHLSPDIILTSANVYSRWAPHTVLVKYVFQIPNIWQFKLLRDGFWLVSDKNGIPLSGNLKSVPGNCFQVLEFCLNNENAKREDFHFKGNTVCLFRFLLPMLKAHLYRGVHPCAVQPVKGVKGCGEGEKSQMQPLENTQFLTYKGGPACPCGHEKEIQRRTNLSMWPCKGNRK